MMIKSMFVAVIILLAGIFAVLVLYLSSAVWSERQAEKKAHADCALAVPGKPLAQLEQQLAQTQGKVSTLTQDGQTYLSSTHRSTIAVSRYVCIVDIVNNLVTTSEVVYKD
jgi:hypothetical protein